MGDVVNVQDYVFGWKVKGIYKGQVLVGLGKVGGMLVLQDVSKFFLLQVEVSVGSICVVVVGILIDLFNFGVFDLCLKLFGISMVNFYLLIGIILLDILVYFIDGYLLVWFKEEGGVLFCYENFNGKVGVSDLYGSLIFVVCQFRLKLFGKLIFE